MRERLHRSRHWLVPAILLIGYALILIARGGSCESCLAGEFIPQTTFALPATTP